MSDLMRGRLRGSLRRCALAALAGTIALGGIAVVSDAAFAQSGGQTGWAGASSSAPSSTEDLRYRLQALDAELADIRARLGETGPLPATGGGVADALSNSAVSSLEREVRRLTAKVEELQNRQRRIAEEAARRFSDIEFRLTILEKGDTSNLEPVPPLGGYGEPSEAEPPPGPAAPEAAPEQGSGSSEAPASGQVSGIVPGPSGQGTFAGVDVTPSTGQATAGQTAEETAAAVPTAARTELDLAVEDVKQGRYDQGEGRLRDFLKTYPSSALAGDAWYWLGDSQSIRGNHTDAARSFLKGYNANRVGPYAPRNLYRLGVTLGRLGQVREACLTLREVRSQFPSAPLVEKADAEADKLACG